MSARPGPEASERGCGHDADRRSSSTRLGACSAARCVGAVGARCRALRRSINPLLLPPLGDVLAMLGELLGRPQVHEAIAVTAAEVIVAFLIAVPLGAAIGVLIAENDYLGDIFKPMLFYVFSMPKSIFLPMFILVFGIGFQQKVAYAAFTTTFVVLMSATAAVESVQGGPRPGRALLRRDPRADPARASMCRA